MKKKILHIAAHLGTGVGKAISGLTEGLNEFYENEVLILEPAIQDRFVKVCENNGVKVTLATCVEDIKAHVEYADYVIFNWWGHPLSLKVFQALKQTKARVFLWSHSNGWFYPYISPEFVDVFDGGLFTSACSFENENWTPEQRKRIAENSEEVYGIGNFRASKIVSKENYDRGNEIILGYTGTVNYNKMSLEFPRICSEIKARVPNVVFKFFGAYDEETYNSFIEYDESLKDCVRFEGFVTDIDKQLLALDIYCYPLGKENFATTDNTMVEAMSAGLPIVVFNNPSERSAITHNVDGLIADTTEEFIQHIVDLCHNPERAEELGRGARYTAVNRYESTLNVARCVTYLEKYGQSEKTTHDFLSVVGETAGENYLYFVNMTKEEYIEKAKKGELLTILRGETKGSLKHYLNYYSDEILEELKNVQGV